MTKTMENFPLFFELIRDYLDLNDLAILACGCRSWNAIVTPFLYESILFHNPGLVEGNDPLQLKLDTFGDLRCTNLKYTRRLLITGSWYAIYHEIDSKLGSHGMLSPAASMFSNIIASCIFRMSTLKEFIWDLAVSPTQHLVTTVAFIPTLEVLYLRVGTDGTPSPYFHPPLNIWPPINVSSLTLIQIDKASVLRSLGSALRSATRLRNLTMWADGDSMLRFREICSSWCQKVPFMLLSLDLRGFIDLGQPSCALWSLLSPARLRALTLYVCRGCDLDDSLEFWQTSNRAGLRPKQLATNLVVPGLQRFLQSFSGLEAFSITSLINKFVPDPLNVLLGALEKNHSETLKFLSVDPNGALANHVFDNALLAYLTCHFLHLEELRIGMVGSVPEDTISTLLRSRRIRLLYIKFNMATKGSIEDLDRYIFNSLQKGAGVSLRYFVFDEGPLFKVYRGPLRVCKETLPMGFIHDTFLLHENVFTYT